MPTPSLPPEILDHTIDTLQDDPKTLRNCCLVAKPWIPRTRKHLFSNIRFHSSERLKSWKKAFPDPSDSPACYARSLFAGCLEVIRAEACWIKSFSGVEHLELEAWGDSLEDPDIFLVPFHNFSPTLKSLVVDFVTLPCPKLFKLVYSFPLLEDLTMICQFLGNDDDPQALQAVLPPTSPPFTGSLKLTLPRGSETLAHQLLDLPGGLHFRQLDLLWGHEEDTQWVRELVSACSNTLESLNMTCLVPGNSNPASTIDLSIAPKLRNVAFWSGSFSVEWITVALGAVTEKIQSLQGITIHLHDRGIVTSGPGVWKIVGEEIHRQWMNLDHLLVQLWESRSIRPQMVCMALRDEPGVRDLFGGLLPEITKRGIIDIVGA